MITNSTILLTEQWITNSTILLTEQWNTVAIFWMFKVQSDILNARTHIIYYTFSKRNGNIKVFSMKWHILCFCNQKGEFFNNWHILWYWWPLWWNMVCCSSLIFSNNKLLGEQDMFTYAGHNIPCTCCVFSKSIFTWDFGLCLCHT